MGQIFEEIFKKCSCFLEKFLFFIKIYLKGIDKNNYCKYNMNTLTYVHSFICFNETA